MKCLVTGGGGFLGSAIVRMLRDRGDDVRSFSRTPAALDVPQFHGDLTDAAALRQALRGCDVVFHVAAKAGIWGTRADFHRTNVVGTQTVLEACRVEGVRRLVYTSTPSVVHGGASLEGITEAAPYPARYQAHYPQTKAAAERAVLAANGPDLATVALRPHLIWGPNDPHLIPRLVAKAKAGKLKRIGTHLVIVDATYVDNAAAAHLLAADKLDPGSVVAGRAYFITNDEPLDLWDFVNSILAVHRLAPVTDSIAPWKAKLAGRLCEALWRVLPGEPPLTRFVVSQLSTSHWYDITAAKRDLGYAPVVSVAEGLRRLAEAMTPEIQRR